MDAASRRFIRDRAGRRCEYCRLTEADLPESIFHCEHIIAQQHGGGDEPANLAWACAKCNHFKGPNLSSIDPLTGQPVLLFHPRRDAWDEHFAIVEAEVIGLTGVGRATARLLDMNSDSRRSVRRWVSVSPPDPADE